jgi:hypothetical protein
MLPRKSAGGDAHDLLRVGDGGADHLRRAAVSFEDGKRALGGGRLDHVAEADAMLKTSNISLSSTPAWRWMGCGSISRSIS